MAGYKSVPTEPTPEMVDAFLDAIAADGSGFIDALRAAIAAAPQPAPDAPKDALVERLRKLASSMESDDTHEVIDPDAAMLREAADAIKLQAEQIAALRGALLEFADDRALANCEESAKLQRKHIVMSVPIEFIQRCAALAAKGGANEMKAKHSSPRLFCRNESMKGGA